jgi:hypothetical protein
MSCGRRLSVPFDGSNKKAALLARPAAERCAGLVAFLLALGLALSARAATDSAQLYLPSNTAQLFVDDFLIASQRDLSRTLHQPKKDNGGQFPVIALENEFDGASATLEANGTIVWDPKLKRHVMFALAFSPPGQGPDRVRLYRFTSADGMNWTKGDAGTPERIGFDLTDARSGRSATGIDLFSCCYDGRGAQYPYKGWLYFANWGDLEGVYFVRSTDGKRWERGPQVIRAYSREIDQDGRKLHGPSDVTIFYHDIAADRFLALLKFHSFEPVTAGNSLRSRAYAFVDELDAPFDAKRIERLALVPPAAEQNGDSPADEYYASTGWRYESVWLGTLKIWHGQGEYPHSAAGGAFLKLAVSRDGLNWEKAPFANDAGVREVFLPNGPEGGNHGRNDGGYITDFSQGPLRIGNELIYYYGASSFGKNHPPDIRVSGGGIFRARLRPDGFVSVDGGVFTTKPFTFGGDDLFVNSAGHVSIRVLGAGDTPLDTATLAGDSLQHEVRFRGKSLRELSKGQAVQLQFGINGGQLYSFAIHPRESRPKQSSLRHFP